MQKRYKIDFEDGVSCVMKDMYPDLIPIVDTKSPFAFGEVCAFAPCEYTAERIVNALNVIDIFEKGLMSPL